ncbi:MAG TPA: glutamate--cysteine ligase [Stellaceae bacterium]|jgi:glutamate--cysteine ligase|nr:glutamate--cysteine ligase [Stellaceae bacterium]
MSAPSHSGGAPVTDKRQLVEYLAAGCKPRAEWRIGTEHEKFIFRRGDLRPVPYEGDAGIRAILERLQRFGWQPVLDGDNIVGLSDGGGAISLEPGGQFELSGAPVENLHQTCAELHTHLKQMREVTEELGLGMLGLGFLPKWKREDCHWMPKRRYAVMRRYMPTKGKLGVDMMLRTCTVQVNLDFASEADMVLKSRVSLALQPLAVALFANSPFIEGKPSGFLSYRSQVWTDVDPDRSGILPFVFDDGFGFERYVDWLLDVPMYFVYRDGNYLDVAGQSFRDFLVGKLPGLPGEIPTLSDWSDHLTTVFPEIRIKRYIEMRGADGGPWRNLCALPAFWTGLLYDDDVLAAAWDLVKDWSAEEREQLRRDVPRLGLETRLRGKKLQDLAIAVVELAKEGLRRRARLSGMGDDETSFLSPVIEAAQSGKTPADKLLDDYATRWRGLVDPVYVEDAY